MLHDRPWTTGVKFDVIRSQSYDPLSNTIEVSLEVRDVSNNKGPQSIDSGLWRVFEKDVCIYL